MSKKKIKIIGTIIAFLLCFPFHFVYDKFPNFLTSVFFPINESIWEHMKLLFGSIVVSGLIQKIILIYKKEDTTNVVFSNFIAAIISIPIFLIMFLPIYYIFGENFKVTIFIMLISIIIAEFISCKITNVKKLNMENKTIILIIIVYIVFGILTYYPLNIELFKDVEQCIYHLI